MNHPVEYVFYAKDELDTESLASHLSKWAAPGVVLALDGDLGAGKTRFSQAFAKGMGVADVVNSPTFTIIKEYEGRSCPLYHMDVYRLNIEEADELGMEEYFAGDGVVLIEWASLIEELLPAHRLHIYIHVLEHDHRRFALKPYGEPYVQYCEELKNKGIVHGTAE